MVLAPFFVWLYERVHPAPFLLNVALLMAMLTYALRNVQLKSADPKPTSQEDTNYATLEKSDEGAG